MEKKWIYILSAIAAALILILSISYFQGKDIQPSTAEAESTTEADAEEDNPDQNLINVGDTEETSLEQEPEEVVVDRDEETEETEEQIEEELEQQEEETVKEPILKTQYVSVSSLNVRSGPGVQNSVLGVLSINEKVEAELENPTNGWVKVTSEKVTGFVNKTYLSDKETEVITSNNTSEKKEESTKKSSTPKEENKSSSDSSPPKEKSPEKNAADKLTTVSGNNQVIIVTTSGYSTSSAMIETFERNSNGSWDKVMSVPGFIGRNGFANTKVEGDGKSPRGKYTIGTAFGQKGNPGTKLSFRGITKDDVWVDDPESALYNTWQSRKETEGQWSSAEDMAIPQYNYGFVINYNTSNPKPYAGSAIFFHVATRGTLGCTGVSEGNMVKILQWLDPAKNPVIIQAPVNELSNY
ncbi:SH3 domain-containing protein [Evansella tamaricis]|uniref:SH3 domain-containing protein n=1 Tax=Evansella tamaricis TaxID=2069301 RepID=A0ABS6JK24_9BACI|nr:SH3 domain-containing protein [Evansella tamaricis]MBU9714025.1 SH3 domain-containing protein [Evansella tamaricis]